MASAVDGCHAALFLVWLSIYADVGIDGLMPTPRLCRPACGMKENPLFDGLFRR